jgi:hypothetical protein
VQAQWANVPKAVAGVNPFGAFQAVGGAASSAAGWFDAHASLIKSVAQGVGTACGLVSLIGVADMVTVPCMLIANGVALAADVDLATHGQVGWDEVGMDVIGVGASVVGVGALGGASELPQDAVAISRAWPKTAEEMDQLLGQQGTRIPDTPQTPGRGKVQWNPNGQTKITFEQHPYHPQAPEWHRGPHWHLDTPGQSHQRFVPGDPIPGM